MRLRISMLVVATSSLVLVSFLVPLALVLRTLAADRAVSAATAEAQSLAPLVTTLTTSSLRLTVDQVNAETSTPVTVFLPSGAELGQPAPVSPAVRLARNGRSFSAEAPGGEQVLVAVEGLAGGPAVIRAFVPDSVLRHGVARAWLLLGGVGLLLLLLSVVVADQLARSLVRPLTALARPPTGSPAGSCPPAPRWRARRRSGGRAPASTGWRSASASCSRTSGRPSPTCPTGCGLP